MSVRNLEDYTDEQLQELAQTITEEEFEQLDELSKERLGAYMGAASNDVADTKWGKHGQAPRVRGEEGKKLRAKRSAGMRKAATKWLAKEEDEAGAEALEDENLEETAALDSVATKTASIAAIVHKMSGMNHDDITKLSQILDQDIFHAKGIGDGAAAANKNSVAAKGSAAAGTATIGAVKEDLINIFGEDQSELSEEFINKTTTLFEAAVNLRVDLIREEVYEEAAQLVDEIVEERVSEIKEKLNDYLDATINEWIEANEVALEQNIRTLRAESFLSDLSDLFEAHNIEIPENGEDVVEALMGEVEELKGRLNEQIEKNIENQKLIDEANREAVFDEIAEGLTATQVEKLGKLVEGFDSSDLDEYRSKVEVIKEQHFKEVKTSNISDELHSEEPEAVKKQASGEMARYSAAIARSVKP